LLTALEGKRWSWCRCCGAFDDGDNEAFESENEEVAGSAASTNRME
jgi:hypothetical protein